MSSSGAPRRAGRTALVLLQLLVFVGYILGPTATLAEDPLPEPTPAESPAPEETPALEPSQAPEPSEAPAPSEAPSVEPISTATPDPEPSSPVPGTEPYLITFAAATSDARQIEILEGAGVTDGAAIPQLRMRSILLHADTEADELAALRASTDVLRVDADRTRAVEAEPSDTSYPDQWSLPHIGWDQLHGSAAIAGTATVAILDTGVDGSHPDSDGVLLPGASVLDGSDGWTDPNGHGTWMAGIVAAETDNGLGVAGTAYAGVSILPVTVLGADGTGQDSDIIAGVVHAADAGADVILMAFSNPGYSAALQAAIDYAWASGAVLVAATGNDGSAGATFPAGDRGVIGVASTDAADELAASSNHGAAAFMAAPGVSIVTTGAGGGVATISGTSAAAASVAGAAALLKANESFLTNGVIVGRLARNADPAGDPADTGNGRLNLLRAMTDTSADPVQPSGAAPIGDGGPQVGPYFAAANSFDVTPLSQSVGAGSTNSFTWSFTAQNSGNVATTTFTIPAGWTAPQSGPGAGRVIVTAGTCAASLASISGQVVTIDQGAGSNTCGNNQTFSVAYNQAVAPSPEATTTYTFANQHGQDPTVQVSVAVNATPVIVRSNGTVVVNEGQTATNSGTWSDANAGDTVTLTASVGTVTQSGTNAAGTWSWSFPTTDGPDQSQTVTITASDGTTSAQTTFLLTVNNVAPTVDITGDNSADEGRTKTYTYTVTDPGADISPATESCGANGHLTNTPAQLSFTCSFPDGPATSTVSVSANDGDPTNNTGADSILVTVANVAPVVTLVGPTSGGEGDTLNYSFTITDPGDEAFSLADQTCDGGVLSNAAFDGTSGSGSFDCTFPDGPASHTVGVTVSDGTVGGTDTQAVTVSNVAPLVTLNGAATGDEGGTLSFSVSTDDPGAEVFTLDAQTCDGGLLTNADFDSSDGSGSFDCTFADNGTFDVSVTVGDGTTSDADTLAVVIANVDPVVTLLGPAVGNEGDTLSYTFSTQDPGDEAFSLVAQTCDGGSLTNDDFDPADGSGSFDCTFSDGPAGHTVSVTVSDGDGGSDSDAIGASIANVKPSIVLTGVALTDEGDTETYSFAVSDPGDDDHTVAVGCGASGDEVPLSFAYNPLDMSGSFKCNFPDGPATSNVTATVTDSDGASDTDNRVVIVTVSNVAPVLTLTGAATGNEGGTLSFSFSTLDPGDEVFTLDTETCDGGSLSDPLFDGTDGSGSFDCTFADNGSFNVSVTIGDGTTSDTATLAVVIANVDPVVTLLGPATGDEGETLSYTFSITDAGTADTLSVDASDCGANGTRSNFNFDGVDSGSFDCTWSDDFDTEDVIVDVSDDDGGSDSDAISVDIANLIPVVTAPTDQTANEGTAKSFSLGSFTDPGADSPWQVTVDWGDPSADTVFTEASAGSIAAKTHTYADDGTYTVTLTVVEENGTGASSLSKTFQVTVANLIPVVTAPTDQTANEGTAKSFSLGSFTDPGADSPWQVTVDWGDPSADTVFTEASAGSIAAKTHTYADDGTYTVTLTVVEENGTGASSLSKTFQVTVANVAPVASEPTFTTVPTVGGWNFTAAFKYSDLGADTQTGTFQWTINGTTTTTTKPGLAAMLPANPASVADTLFLGPGCYTISVEMYVTDDGGLMSNTVSAGTGAAPIDIYAASFQAPIRDNERNVAKYGNVVPIKVELKSMCISGTTITSKTLHITIADGNVADIDPDLTPTIVAESVSNADTGSVMRVNSSGYIYNFSTKQLKQGQDYTIRIRDGVNGPIILKALFQPKK